MQACTVYQKATTQWCSSVIARPGETARAALTVLTGFMVQTREARRGETPSGEGGKKSKGKGKATVVKRKGEGAARITPRAAARSQKKKKKKKEKKRKTGTKKLKE